MKRGLLFLVFVAAGIAGALWLKPRVSRGGDGAGAAVARRPGTSLGNGDQPVETSPRPIIRVKTRSPAQQDPTRPDYDPVRLVDLTDRSPQDVYAAEPRDEAWASAFEQQLATLVARDLEKDFPGAEVLSVECRTSSCSIAIEVSPEESKSANKFAQLYVLLGETVAPGGSSEADDGDHILTYYGLLPPEWRDPDEFAARYEHDRELTNKKLEWFREQLRKRRGEGDAP